MVESPELKCQSMNSTLGMAFMLKRTFCHVFAPYLAAFGHPNASGVHPAPWKAVSGGVAYDVLAQLYVPVDFNPGPWFDRLNTIWWFAALLRLKGNPLAIVPVIGNHPFAEMATMDGEPTFWPIEMHKRRLCVEKPNRTLSRECLDWIKEHWAAGGDLMRQSDDFNVAVQAFDSSTTERSPSVALVTLWGALERLFSPSHQELTFRVSANIAAYLEPLGETRLTLYKVVKKLYGARSKAAHGAGDEDGNSFVETYRLLKRVIVKIIESRHVPNRDELETFLFT
jgi:hypothetical protein